MNLAGDAEFVVVVPTFANALGLDASNLGLFGFREGLADEDLGLRWARRLDFLFVFVIPRLFVYFLPVVGESGGALPVLASR